jgi:hypothetical protein
MTPWARDVIQKLITVSARAHHGSYPEPVESSPHSHTIFFKTYVPIILPSIHTKFWVENLKGRDCLKDIGVDGSITLEWILEKYGGKLWTGFIWFRIGTSGGLP